MSTVLSPTRRGVLTGIASLSLAAPLATHAGVHDRADALARALRAMRLPFSPAQVDLLRYGDGEYADGVLVQAVVRLTWAPGYRTRKLVVQAPDYERGHSQMVQETYGMFSAPR